MTPANGPTAPAAPAVARDEWRRDWPQPLICMVGLAGGAMFNYSTGVFMGPMTSELGWGKGDFALGLTIASLCGLLFAPIVGGIVDRAGSRKVALIGVPAMILYFSLLGVVSNSLWQWWAFCAGLSVILPMLSPSVWIAAVTKRFVAGRGLAFALALSGSGLAAALWPTIAAYHLSHWGWRLAYPAVALTWGIVALPLVIFYFARGDAPFAAQKPADRRSPPGFSNLLLTRSFIMLAGGGALFAMLTLGMTIHMVEILKGKGLPLMLAASTAGAVGLFSIVGRLGAGTLLDRVPIPLIAFVSMLVLPIVSALALLFLGGEGGAILAVVTLGIAHGAEIDVITFVAARRFASERFASVYSVMMALLTVGASIGPTVAGRFFDHTGSYTSFLLLSLPLFVVASILVIFADKRGMATGAARTSGEQPLLSTGE